VQASFVGNESGGNNSAERSGLPMVVARHHNGHGEHSGNRRDQSQRAVLTRSGWRGKNKQEPDDGEGSQQTAHAGHLLRVLTDRTCIVQRSRRVTVTL
jgi:hypothetical protein